MYYFVDNISHMFKFFDFFEEFINLSIKQIKYIEKNKIQDVVSMHYKKMNL